MEHLPVEEVASEPATNGVDRRELSDPLGTTDVAVNRYRVAPGEGLPGGLHAHADQEEVFVVFEGELTFETLEAELVVGAGEAVRFAPGEFQSGRNDSGTDLVVLAIGAPRDSEDVRLPVGCPECGHAELRMDADGEFELVCPACGVGHVPAPCPECGHEDLRVTLASLASEGDGTGGSVVACRGCDATFETPPFRD